MAEPLTRDDFEVGEGPRGDALGDATARLDSALRRLEARLEGVSAGSPPVGSDASPEHRRLEVELKTAREHGQALEAAAAEASAALGRAMDEMHLALGSEPLDDAQGELDLALANEGGSADDADTLAAEDPAA